MGKTNAEVGLEKTKSFFLVSNKEDPINEIKMAIEEFQRSTDELSKAIKENTKLKDERKRELQKNIVESNVLIEEANKKLRYLDLRDSMLILF